MLKKVGLFFEASRRHVMVDFTLAAISICFSMTEVFRSEILGVVMQQIMDEPAIPLLFMRTVSLHYAHQSVI